jgi:hypothetical protein
MAEKTGDLKKLPFIKIKQTAPDAPDQIFIDSLIICR